MISFYVPFPSPLPFVSVPIPPALLPPNDLFSPLFLSLHPHLLSYPYLRVWGHHGRCLKLGALLLPTSERINLPPSQLLEGVEGVGGGVPKGSGRRRVFCSHRLATRHPPVGHILPLYYCALSHLFILFFFIYLRVYFAPLVGVYVCVCACLSAQLQCFVYILICYNYLLFLRSLCPLKPEDAASEKWEETKLAHPYVWGAFSFLLERSLCWVRSMKSWEEQFCRFCNLQNG